MKPSDPGGTRADYPWFATVTTRWMDNDIYGHVNNVVYYSFFDTAIADFLVREGGFAFADASLAKQILNWEPRYNDVKSIVETALRWHQSHPNGYAS